MSSAETESVEIIDIKRDLDFKEIGELLKKMRESGERILRISASEARKIEVCLQMETEPTRNPDAILAGLLHADLRRYPAGINFCSDREQRVLEKYPARQHTDTELIHALLAHDQTMRDSPMRVAGGFGEITAQ